MFISDQLKFIYVFLPQTIHIDGLDNDSYILECASLADIPVYFYRHGNMEYDVKLFRNNFHLHAENYFTGV